MTFKAGKSEAKAVQHEIVFYFAFSFDVINFFLTYNKLKLNNRFNFKVITARKHFAVKFNFFPSVMRINFMSFFDTMVLGTNALDLIFLKKQRMFFGGEPSYRPQSKS